MTLSAALAAKFAATALGHVTREYPNKPGNVLAGPADARTPRDLHPVFFGSFDWHSCVHAYWMLARLLRLFPAMAPASEIRSLFEGALTPDKVAVECATFGNPMAAGFERPYGWAWLLKLHVALAELPDRRWHEALAPLTCPDRPPVRGFPVDGRPTRFGWGRISTPPSPWPLPREYASAAHPPLGLRRWSGWPRVGMAPTQDCQAWEPSGDDFLSPALIEGRMHAAACCHRRGLRCRGSAASCRISRKPVRQTLFAPVSVSDRSDGKIAHLDGVNLSRRGAGAPWPLPCRRAMRGA